MYRPRHRRLASREDDGARRRNAEAIRVGRLTASLHQAIGGKDPVPRVELREGLEHAALFVSHEREPVAVAFALRGRLRDLEGVDMAGADDGLPREIRAVAALPADGAADEAFPAIAAALRNARYAGKELNRAFRPDRVTEGFCIAIAAVIGIRAGHVEGNPAPGGRGVARTEQCVLMRQRQRSRIVGRHAVAAILPVQLRARAPAA